MSDEASIYLLNTKKLLGKASSQATLPEVNVSVDQMLKFLNSSDKNFESQYVDTDLLFLSKKLQGQSSPVKLFAKQKYEKQGYLSQSKRSILQQKLFQQSEKYREKQIIKQIDHVNLNKQIVQSLNQFDDVTNPKLPVEDIIRQCHIYQDYLKYVPTVRQIPSAPAFRSQIQDITTQLDIFPHNQKQKLQFSTQEVQIQLEQESAETQDKQKENYFKQKISGIVRKNAKFTKLFGSYLKYLIKFQFFRQQQSTVVTQYATLQNILHQLPQIQQIQNKEFLESLTKGQYNYQITTYGEKPTLSTTKLFQVVANKRIGDSNKFHPKTFIMNGDQLVYYGQDSNMKMIVVKPHLLQIKTVQKQVGGFFSREKKSTQTFKVTGENKQIQIEYSQLQGSQMYKSMTVCFAERIYQSYCIETCTCESQFLRFIKNDKQTYWNFTQMNVQNDLIEYCLPFWIKCVTFHSVIKSVNFRNNGWSPISIELILKNIYTFFPTDLQNLQISGNKFHNDGVKMYCICFQHFKNLTRFQLRDCGIMTVHIQSIANYFTQLQQRSVTLFDISQNHNFKVRQTSSNIFNILQIFRPNILNVSDSQLTSQDFIDFLHFRYDIIQLCVNNCGLLFDDQLINSMYSWIQRAHKFKILKANNNKVTASFDKLLQFLSKPQLQQIALDFDPSFFTDIVNPDNDWSIVPL